MKTFYTMLLFTAIGLSANAATNNNADKILHIENKAMPASVVYNYPSADGGAYVIYQPQLIYDSICITRLDAMGNTAWTKKFLKAAFPAEFTTTNDNALLMMLQGDDIGNALVKLSATGSIDFLNSIYNNSYFGIERAENGYVTLGGTYQGQLWFNEILPTGLSDVGLMISAAGSFSDDLQGTTVTYNENSNEAFFSSKYDNKLAVVKVDTARNVLWSKLFNAGSNQLQPLKHIQLRDGNIVVSGINTNSRNGFMIKLDADNGNVIWANEYDLSYGSFTTTVSNESYTVKGAGFDRLVEMPDGSICSVSYNAIPGLSNFWLSSLSNVANDGSFASSHYAHNGIPTLFDGVIAGQKFTRIVNFGGEADGYYLGHLGLFPDTNTVSLLSLNKVPLLCNIVSGVSNTSELMLTSEDLPITVYSGSIFDKVNVANVVDGSVQLSESELCFSTTQNSTTGINEAPGLLFDLLPNPAIAGKQAVIRLSNPSEIQCINLIDITGKTLLSTSDVKTENTLNLNNVAEGTYIIQLKGTNTTISRKLVVIE